MRIKRYNEMLDGMKNLFKREVDIDMDVEFIDLYDFNISKEWIKSFLKQINIHNYEITNDNGRVFNIKTELIYNKRLELSISRNNDMGVIGVGNNDDRINQHHLINGVPCVGNFKTFNELIDKLNVIFPELIDNINNI